MKKNILIVFLLSIVIIQWFLISFLLMKKSNNELTSASTSNFSSSIQNHVGINDSLKSEKNNEGISESNSKEDLKEEVVLERSNDAISKKEDSVQRSEVKKIDRDNVQYEGVAATLMINAPKWFQKRYSTMLSNIYANTPANWAIQIFYIQQKGSQSEFGLHINPNLSRLNATNDRIIFTPIPPELVSKHGERKKLLYWTDEWLWESMVADDVLVFNGNGVICSNGKLSILDGSAYNELFKDLDYLGSPWRSMYGEGGDGSYSYRNRKAMLDALRYRPYEIKNGREDAYFLRNLKDMNEENQKKGKGGKIYKIATKEQTHLFAGNLDSFTIDGSDPPPLPLVVSGTMPSLEHDVRQNILSACPELGMMFPLLHHPSCFGAHPDGEECGKHICALKDQSERKSGC